jgi:hypothetical protein
MDNEKLKNYRDNIENHLGIALNIAQQMQTEVQQTEGDSDLFRKLSMYLTPNLNHWINGAQAGNMKDLKETLTRREAAMQQGDSKPST